MKPVVLASIALFWIATLAIGVAGLLAGRPVTRQVTREDVSKHRSPSDCWIVVSGGVYDISSYIDKHPTPAEVLTVYCGRDATDAYRTKGGAGRSHSSAADELLESFRVGRLSTP